MIKAVIFDCFGVVVANGLEAALLRLEHDDPGLREFVRGVVARGNQGLISQAEMHRLIAEHVGVSPAAWGRLIYGGEVRNPDVIRLIQELRKQYKTGLLSNLSKGGLKQRFTNAELTDWFDAVVVSGEVGMVKPDPEIYRLAAERLGVQPPDCVFIDDWPAYVDGARAVGMQALRYEGFPELRRKLDALLAA